MEENKPVTAEELAEELWDQHSEHIDDNVSSLERVAGTSVIFRREFISAMKQGSRQLTAEYEHDTRALGEIIKSKEVMYQDLMAENERPREVAFSARGFAIMIHDKLSKLDIPMDEYTPISELLINLKALLNQAGIKPTP